MKILVTAGNTQTPIDRVRCITNIFSGKTGTLIALRAFDFGHDVTLLTSHPEVAHAIPAERPRRAPQWDMGVYRTFDDLEKHMAKAVTTGDFDVVIHAAAVSDYHMTGVYRPDASTHFDAEALVWQAAKDTPRMLDAAAWKVKSHHDELWLRLAPTAKLVDRVREVWGFRATLVKFKLEVGVADTELLAIAERSRLQSSADLMVANTLEAMHEWAWLGAGPGGYKRVARTELPGTLIAASTALASAGQARWPGIRP